MHNEIHETTEPLGSDELDFPKRPGTKFWLAWVFGSAAFWGGLGAWASTSRDVDFDMEPTLMLAGFFWLLTLFTVWAIERQLYFHKLLKHVTEAVEREAARQDEAGKQENRKAENLNKEN